MWLVLSPLPDMTGSGCEHNGVIYRNGQSFKPSCKYQCVCVNGAIGCVTLCPESQPPRVWCQTPRRVKVPGQCCEQWICDEPKRGRKTAPRHAVEGRTPWELGGGSILCSLVKLAFILETLFFTHLLYFLNTTLLLAKDENWKSSWVLQEIQNQGSTGK